VNERKKNDYAEAKLPPSDIETEKAVLGAILIHADIFPDVNEILKTADCFYDKYHQTIYSVILKMFAVSATIDILTVTSESLCHSGGNKNPQQVRCDKMRTMEYGRNSPVGGE